MTLGWFGTAYSITLYRQARSVTADESEKVKMVWFWVVAIIGWVLFILSAIGVFAVALGNWKIF